MLAAVRAVSALACLFVPVDRPVLLEVALISLAPLFTLSAVW
jgi:hypothetical protein